MDLLICFITLLAHVSILAIVIKTAVTETGEKKPSSKQMLWFGELFSFYKNENRLALGFEAIRIARITMFALWLVFLTYNPTY
jgi:hypothetical protein